MKLTIATRGSKLALWQAHHTKERLLALQEGLTVELLVLKTKGDKILDVPLAKIGGKGLFVKEIEMALLDGRADIAVHSMKDVPSSLEGGLHMAAVSQRANPHDALCSTKYADLDELPQGARLGTSSLRRGCQLLAERPDLEVVSLRGNVPTRVAKLDAGEFDAIVLAAAGLERLGLGERITQELPASLCLPACGQGALGIETRADDESTTALAKRAMHHEGDAARIYAERGFLLELEGGCQAPMAAHATYDGAEMLVRALVGQPDGSVILRAESRGKAEDAAALGKQAAHKLLDQGAGKILEALMQA